MTHKKTVRPAMTALAAVIAFSSAPTFAQSADQPIVTTTPAIDVAPAPIMADPVAPAPAAETTAADPLAATAKPKLAARKATTTKTATVRSRPTPARAATVAPAVGAAPAVIAPAAEMPVESPLQMQPEVAPAPGVADTPPATAETTMNEMLPAAGIGGLALVLLAGTGLAVRRRRRRAQEAEAAAWQDQAQMAAEPAEPAPAMIGEPAPALELTQPAFAAAPASATAVEASTEVDGPVTELPEGFDLSRFGFNVQEAYKGPTEDNPSLSLKHRLRRASGMDQQERKLDAEVEAVTGESPLAVESESAPPAESAAAKTAAGSSTKGDFMLPRYGTKPIVRPTYTH